MANTITWAAGAGVGFTWTTCINGSDMASMADSNFVLSTVADITNQTSLDLYADISAVFTIASSTPRSGAYIGVYLFPLQCDGSTYGDGQFVAGTQKAAQPASFLVGTIGLQAAAMTTMAGLVQGVLIPPGTFRFGIYNYSNVTFPAAGSCVVKYRTYKLNDNA
jgi:hypothetical protein